MKLHLLAVVLLPAAAAAQFSPISPRINPLVGLPAVLPSPAISPLSGGIQLPTPLPALTPSLILAAPAVSLALSAPATAAPLAQPAVSARRENVSTPLSGLPSAVIRVENRHAAEKTPAANELFTGVTLLPHNKLVVNAVSKNERACAMPVSWIASIPSGARSRAAWSTSMHCPRASRRASRAKS